MPSRNEKRFEFRLGRRGLLLFAAGMSALVFASFWVGLQMGRNMETPAMQMSRMAPPLVGTEKGNLPTPGPAKVVETPAVGGEKAATAAAAPGVAPAPQTASSGTGSPVPLKQAETKPAPVPSSASASGTVPLPDGAAAQKATAPPAAGAVGRAPAGERDAKAGKSAPSVQASVAATRGVETAVAPPKKTAEPAKGAGTAKESFILQVASYKEKVKAEETAKKLGSMGFRPRIQAVDLPAKGRWFRIVVGGFESRDAAQKAADKISKKLKGINCIVRKV